VGCDYVSRDAFNQPGIIHLEPPAQALILFRVESRTADRIRTVSPDCEIDGGGVPLHWLNDVNPAQSVALLAGFVTPGENALGGAMNAIAVHEGAAGGEALDRFAASGQPQSIRLRAVSALGWARGRHGFEVLKALLATDADERVCERAISAIASSKEPQAVDVLIAVARTGKNPRLRAQAVGELARKPGPGILGTLGDALQDEDPQVQRRAVNALREVPDGQGIPLLIQVVKTSHNEQLRKEAMNSLRDSRDPRALSFFEDVLKQ
jgi:HEAT repeat protein